MEPLKDNLLQLVIGMTESDIEDNPAGLAVGSMHVPNLEEVHCQFVWHFREL